MNSPKHLFFDKTRFSKSRLNVPFIRDSLRLI